MKWKQDLDKDIRTENAAYNDQDLNFPHPSYYHGQVEFTEANQNSLLEYFLKVRDNCKAILEIGVCRNGQNSSTYVFLNNKLDNTKYVGIDLEDKSFLNNTEKNIYTIKDSSSNIESNIEKIKSLEINEFDFIFIDGWHSINQVLTDWEYTNLLSNKGIVGFHDVSCHPGPHAFINAVNKIKWNVVTNTCPKDWGIGFVWQK